MQHGLTSGLMVFLTFFLTINAFCGGTQDGGGGSEEAKMFMKTARAKVMLLVGNPKTIKFGLQLLETIEARPVINIVPSLAKVCDGKALASHYAFSCRGQINLLKSHWSSIKEGGRGWLETNDNADLHWQDILHELARASDKASKKYLTDDEGFTETTNPIVVETINRGSGMNIDIVTPTRSNLKASLDQYLQTISTFGLGDEIFETNWHQLAKPEWWDIRRPQMVAQATVSAALQDLIKAEFRTRISELVQYDQIKQCQAHSPGVKFDFRKPNETSAVDSFSSYYRSRESRRNIYCGEGAAYLKAVVRLNSKLKSLDQDFQQFLVGRHIQKITEDFTGSLQEFIKGLSAIEINPVISRNRFAAFGVRSSAEVHMWMDYHIAKVRLALAYVKFVDRLNLGFEIKGLMYSLRQQAVGALRKLNQFEDPAIYIVQIDYDNDQKPTVSPVFELDQLRALVQAADVGLPSKGTTLIRNRSRVEAAGYTAALTAQFRCDVVFAKMLEESIPQRIIDGANEFRAGATFLFKNCADRFEMKQHKTFDEMIMYQGDNEEGAQEKARQGAVAQLTQLKSIPNCAVYEVLSNSSSKTNSDGHYVGTGIAVMRWVCLRPSIKL